MKQHSVQKTFSYIVIAALLALSLTSLSVQPAQAASVPPVCSSTGLATAITSAASGDTIDYAADCAISLSAEITISKNITIDGNDHRVVLTAASGSRLFTISSGVTVTLRGLELTGGNLSNNNGGAIYLNGGSLTIENSTLRNNAANQTSGSYGLGGAIYTTGGSLTVRNSTIASNTAENNGGAIYVLNPTTAVLQHVTVANNSGSGAVYLRSTTSGTKTLNVRNTILASNTGNNCGSSSSSGSAVISSDGGNVRYPSYDSSCSGTYSTGNPNLGSLAYSSGATQTLAITSGSSSAVNHGSATYCLTTDQRGASRAGTCDSGAYEYNGAGIVTSTTIYSSANPVEYGNAVTLTAAVFPAPAALGAMVVTESGTTVGSGTVDATGKLSVPLGSTLSTGTHNYVATYTPAAGDTVSLGSSNSTAPFAQVVTTRVITVTPASGQTKVYGTTDPTLNYTVTSGSLLAGDSFSGALSRAAGENVGSYAISQGTLAVSNPSHYTITVAVVNFSITARPITVAPDPGQTKVYGDADPAFAYSITSGSLVGTDAFSGALTRAAGENVNNYAITRGTLALSSNYTITFTPGVTFAITARSVTVTPDAGQTKVYGNTDPAFTYQLTTGSIVTGDHFTGALSRVAGENVGDYAFTQGSLALSSNYTLTVTPDVLFSITIRVVTVMPDAGQTKVYGNTDPAFTYQLTTGSVVTGDHFTGALAREAGEDVDTYAITQGSLALSSNYTLTVTPDVTFAITARPVSVVPDSSQSKVYGTLDAALTYHLSSGALATGDDFSGALERAAGETVGDYAISQGNLALSDNYTLTFTSGVDFSITARPVTVTPGADQTKVYGEADPVFDYGITSGSIVTGDHFTGVLSRAAGANIGVYEILPGSLSLGSNYTLTVTPDVTFSITARPVTLVPDAGQSKVYGAADPVLSYHLSSGTLATGDAFTGALARAAGTVVGDYAVTQGNLALNSNYTLTFTPGVTFAITVRPVTVTADAKAKVYGDADPALTYQVTSGSLVAGDSFAGALTRAAGEDVDTYAISQGTLALNSNYALTYVGANLTVTPAQLTFTADNKTKQYKADLPALTYQVAGLKNGDTESDLGGVPALTTTAQKDSAGGEYEIIISVGTLNNSNYEFHFVNGTLTIYEYQFFLSFTKSK